MKDMRVWVAAAGFLIAAWLLGPFVLPHRAPAVSDVSPPQIRYVCRKSGAVFTLPMTGELLAHPETGEMTLVPAVYDKRRMQWRPGPPLEVMRRQGLLAPVP